MPDATSPSAMDGFITRWQNSGAAERSNYALFLSELCDLLGVPRPAPSTDQNERNDYIIDRAFTRVDKDGNPSTVYLDLYKPDPLAACFGKRTQARIRAVTEILDTLEALGKL